MSVVVVCGLGVKRMFMIMSFTGCYIYGDAELHRESFG